MERILHTRSIAFTESRIVSCQSYSTLTVGFHSDISCDIIVKFQETTRTDDTEVHETYISHSADAQTHSIIPVKGRFCSVSLDSLSGTATTLQLTVHGGKDSHRHLSEKTDKIMVMPGSSPLETKAVSRTSATLVTSTDLNDTYFGTDRVIGSPLNCYDYTKACLFLTASAVTTGASLYFEYSLDNTTWFRGGDSQSLSSAGSIIFRPSGDLMAVSLRVVADTGLDATGVTAVVVLA